MESLEHRLLLSAVGFVDRIVAEGGHVEPVYADVDSDGDIDVLFFSSGPGRGDARIGWHENLDGKGNFGDEQVFFRESARSSQWGELSVAAGELDGDGDVDVLASKVGTAGLRQNDGTVFWLENTNGTGTFGKPQVIAESLMRAKAMPRVWWTSMAMVTWTSLAAVTEN